MKKVILILLSIAISFLSLGAQSEEGERTVVTLSKPGQAVQLNANLLNGSIKVTGYNGKEVIVSAVPRGKVFKGDNHISEAVDTAMKKAGEVLEDLDVDMETKEGSRKTKVKKDRQGMKRIGGTSGAGLVIREKNNVVDVEIESIWASVDLDIKVPSNTSVKLEAVNGGALIVNGLSGRHELQHVNGKIIMSDISGSVLAATTNGDVTIAFKQIDPKEEMSFSSFNGDVDVTFPAALKAEVVFSTERGEIYSDFEVDSRSVTDKKVSDRRSTGGRFEVRFDKAIHGQINGGGQKISFKTFNGDILIRKNK